MKYYKPTNGSDHDAHKWLDAWIPVGIIALAFLIIISAILVTLI